MIKFDDGETVRLLQKKKLSLNVSYVLFALLIVSAVLAAVLARGAVSDDVAWSNYIYALAFAAVCLVAFIGVIAFLVVPTEKKLKYAVGKEIAKGLLAREDMFKGGGIIEFVADYSGDVLTLSRKNFTGAISIDPSRLTASDGLGGAGAKIEMDLKPLKAVPALYATAGTKLWQFLQGYYALHGEENGAERVTVTDNMGKTPLTLTVFDKGAPAKNNAKNYFIEKGLIK